MVGLNHSLSLVIGIDNRVGILFFGFDDQSNGCLPCFCRDLDTRVCLLLVSRCSDGYACTFFDVFDTQIFLVANL